MSYADVALHRSYLYAPGSSSKVMRQALQAGADAVIFDLEDAVPPNQKDDARRRVAEMLDELGSSATSSARSEVHVRINRHGDCFDINDLDAVVRPAVKGIRLPKVETAMAVTEAVREIERLEATRNIAPNQVQLYPTVESARGLFNALDVARASPRVARLAFGATDFLADIGAQGDDDLATLHPRCELVVVSRVAGIGPPIDSVYTALEDERGLQREATRARSLGFFGKSIIHPRQLRVVHEAFTPTLEEVARARALIDAVETSVRRGGSGAASVEGQFVDKAVVLRARRILEQEANDE